MDHDEYEDLIHIVLTHDDAKRFARLLRMVGTYEPDSPLAVPFDSLALSLGSHMRITNNTDEQMILDEGLDELETVTWDIYDGHSLSDHVTPTTETVRVP